MKSQTIIRLLLVNTRRSCQGFTLIELLIIVTIIIMTSIYLIPNIRSQRQRQALKNASDQLLADFKSTQNSALAGVKCGTNIDTTAGSWNIDFIDDKSYRKIPTCLDGTTNPAVTYSFNSEVKIQKIDIAPTCSEAVNFDSFQVKFANITGITSFEAPVGCLSNGSVISVTLQLVADPNQTKVVNVSRVDTSSGANIYAN